MSRTRRANRDEMGRGRRQEPRGIKMLGQMDYEAKQAKAAGRIAEQETEVSNARRTICAMRKSTTIVTIGNVKGFAYAFRFEEVWAHLFPHLACPARK